MKLAATEISRILASVLENEKDLSDFVRAVRWGEGPMYFVGSRTNFPASVTAAMAFEIHLGMPAIARLEAEFLAYSLNAVRPRSAVFVILPLEDEGTMLGAASVLKAKGARLFALGAKPGGALGSVADGVAPIPAADGSPASQSPVARHATLAYLALIAARILKSPDEQRRREEAEFLKLPEHVDRTLTEWSGAVEVFASEIKKANRLTLAGGGRFFPPVLEISKMLDSAGGIASETRDIAQTRPPRLPAEARALILSCSRSALHVQIHRWAEDLHKSGGEYLTLTDAADKRLHENSRLSLLLPALHEAAASILQLAVAEAWCRALSRLRTQAP